MNPILRGKILNFMAEIFPRSAEKLSIVGVFFEYHKVCTIEQCLEYLVGKGYLERIEQPHPYKRREKVLIYKITSEGIDINEGVKTDPGVTVVPEAE